MCTLINIQVMFAKHFLSVAQVYKYFIERISLITIIGTHLISDDTYRWQIDIIDDFKHISFAIVEQWLDYIAYSCCNSRIITHGYQ